MTKLTEQLGAADDRADLTPLIDCVFLLLLFFVVTAVFVEESNLFRVDLPKAANAELRELKDVIVVMVSKTGQFSVGADFVPDEELYERLRTLNDEQPIRTLVVKGDRTSPLEKAVMVIDVAQELDIQDVTLAVEVEQTR